MGSENAGMSSERWARNPSVESLRFPGEGSSSQGKPGPKPRLKSVGDGHTVRYSVALFKFDAGTQKDSQSARMEKRGLYARASCS